MKQTKTIELNSSNEQSKQLLKRWVILPFESINTLYAFLIFWLLMVVTVPIAWIKSKLHPEHPRSTWLLFGLRLVRMYAYLAGVRLKIENAQYLPKDDQIVVFATNHASYFDAMLWGAIYQRRGFSLTLPPGRMPWPFELWSSNMGNIAIARDDEERKQFPHLPWGEQAVQAAVKKMLIKKKSVLVFPEGHLERKRRILHFHTGAVRIALQAGVPIVPITIRNADRVFSPNRMILWPGTITFRLHKPLDLSPYYGKHKNRPLVRQLTGRLQRAIVRDMPEYFRHEEHDDI